MTAPFRLIALAALLAAVPAAPSATPPPAPAPAKAAAPAPQAAPLGDHEAVLIVTPGGCYELTLSAAGVPVLTPSEHHYTQVIVMGQPTPGPNPPPVPDPTPPPSPLTERGKAIQAAATAVTGDPNRAATAQGLAMMYRMLTKQVRDGTVKDQATLDPVLMSMTDLVLLHQQATEQWKLYRSTFSTWATAAKAKGLADFTAFLDEAAAGLDASAPQKSIDPAFWKWLIEVLLPILISLLQPK